MEAASRAGCVQLSAAAYAATGLPESTLPVRVVDGRNLGLVDAHLMDTSDSGTGADAGVSVAALRALLEDAPSSSVSSQQEGDAVLSAPRRASLEDVSAAEAAAFAADAAAEKRAAAEAEAAMVDAHAVHFATQACIAMAPSIFYIALGWAHHEVFVLPTTLVLFKTVFVCTLFALRRVLPASVRDALARRWPLVFLFEHAMMVACITLVLMGDFVRFKRAAGIATPAVAARRYFWAIHLALTPLNWIIAQLPLRVAFGPEARPRRGRPRKAPVTSRQAARRAARAGAAQHDVRAGCAQLCGRGGAGHAALRGGRARGGGGLHGSGDGGHGAVLPAQRGGAPRAGER